MKMGEDARDFIINLTPLVLRVSLEVFYVDEQGRGELEMLKQSFKAKTTEFFFSLPDSLNLHDEVISVFLKTEHYDIIYRRNWCSSFSLCIRENSNLISKLTEEAKANMEESNNQELVSQDKTQDTKKRITNNIMILRPCGHSFDHTIHREHIQLNFLRYIEKFWYQKKGIIFYPGCP